MHWDKALRASAMLIVLGLWETCPTLEAASYMFTTPRFPSFVQSSDVEGINDSGQMVGSFLDGYHAPQGFLLTNSTFSVINVPGAYLTEIYGINNLGQMVGISDSSSGSRGFLYGGGVFTTIDDPNGYLPGGAMPRGINNLGQIVGSYIAGPDVGHGFSTAMARSVRLIFRILSPACTG
jgi:probable HAF family extracellular repeat protein